MSFSDEIRERSKRQPGRIVFPESEEPRVLAAVSFLSREGIVQPILIGDPEGIRSAARKESIDLGGVEILDMRKSPLKSAFANTYYELRKHKGVTESEAVSAMEDPIYFGTMMVREGEADGYLAGAITTTAKTVQAGLRILKTKPGIKTVSSFFFMDMKDDRWGENGILVMADAAIVTEMTSEVMAEIALMTAENVKAITGMEPRVAMLSYSTKGSGRGERVEMVRKATEIVKKTAPDLVVDGELQADAAIVEKVAALKAPDSPVAGRANVLIFPCIESANISYKLVQRLAGADAIGPVLQGLTRPANDLSRGCSVDDIITTAAITSLQSQI